jgi:hypothetical protein
MTFKTQDQAFKWALTNGRDNCRPCDRWQVVKDATGTFRVAIRFKSSGKFVGYAV